MPRAQETTQKRDYSKDVDPGATSSGVEYISAVADVFKPQSETKFKLVDTDLIQGRRTLVYEYEVSQGAFAIDFAWRRGRSRWWSARADGSGLIAN